MKHNILFFCLTLFICKTLFSQSEYIDVFPSQSADLKDETIQSSLVTLPFFDDFAYPYTKPLPSLWQDDDAYVNAAFAKNPVTIGVATLDALNRNGELHENVGTTARVSDYLTSLPLNLKNYQPQFASDKLYKKKNNSFVLLDDSYFLYDAEQNLYVSVTQGIIYTSRDTIYQLQGTTYVAQNDSLYDENKKYIDGSYNHELTILSYEKSDSLALSFFFEGGGMVDAPEKNDSLVLEFYAPYDTAGIFINEICSQGIEIYNATDSIISLKDYFLVLENIESIIAADSLAYYQLTDLQVAPYQHVIISAEMLNRNALTDAKAFLYSPDTLLLDSVNLAQSLVSDVVYARLTDGNPKWSYTAMQTLGSCNPSWIWMWSTSGFSSDTMQSAFIPIVEQKYLVKGFRFRFKNYTSLSNDESHARNEDFWHLDMVLLDANRTYTNPYVADVAFVSEISPLYSRYKAVPMTHFSEVSNSDFRMTVTASFKNFDVSDRKLKFNFDVVKEQSGDVLHFPTYETDLPAQMKATEKDILTDFDVDFYDNLQADIASYDEANYSFLYYFTDKNNLTYSQYRWNDTCRSTITVSNYYAYDDGTPEAGYGLREAPMGKVAFRYDILRTDTLKSIAMYFNPTMLATTTTFNLCVWENSNGQPGKLLYYSPSEKTQYADLYEFIHYDIEPENIVSGEEKLIVGKSFFIGWEQPNDVLLNVGIDMNTTQNGRLLYNLGFEWETSVQTGVLMIRPYFGKYEPITAIPNVDNSSCVVYPNIAKEYIYTSVADVQTVSLKKISGEIVRLTQQNYMYVGDIACGVYIVEVRDIRGNLYHQTIVVND